MNVIYSVKDYMSNVFHQDPGSGAIDVVAIQQPDGRLRCSPFHVHFGSLKLKDDEKQQITLQVNGQVVTGVRMKLGAAGEAYFVHQVQEPVGEKDYLASPLPSPLSSIGDTEELVLNDTDAGTFEPEDEDAQMHFNRTKRSESTDRLMWGWGALPIVRPEDEELPSMVKSASVYFDAVDIETTTAGEDVEYYDHPSMSLCGKLLEDAETEEDVHRIFSEHIVTFDFFRANPVGVLANPELRFFVDGKVSTYDADMQAYLVSRVLFPYSQHLAVGSEPNVVYKNMEDNAIGMGGKCGDNTKISGTLSRSALDRGFGTLEPLEEVCSDDGGSTQDTASFTSEPYLKKSLKPSQEELLEMGLRVGMNDITFILRSHGTGELARVTAKLYMWPVTTKVVIAQIDGAISSSAATGSMFKRRDPSAMHPGAVEFYSKLARNGYRIVYVTCHGLSQANLLHTLLHNNTSEDGEIALPMGPVLLSPDHLVDTYSTEMIDTEDFKVAALGALRSLFPREVNPFYAAFGTTQSDSVVFTQLLKKAEELTARDGLQYCKKYIQRAAVYQNIANYYKKQKKYQAALQTAEKAVRINDKLAPNDRFPIAYFLQACLHGLLQEPAKAGFMYTACLTVAESQRPSYIGAIEWANLNMPEQTRDALASAMEVVEESVKDAVPDAEVEAAIASMVSDVASTADAVPVAPVVVEEAVVDIAPSEPEVVEESVKDAAVPDAEVEAAIASMVSDVASTADAVPVAPVVVEEAV
ncbi:Lipin-like protein, partial [Phytophthora palmivora]